MDRKIKELWAEVLDKDESALKETDSFFEVGGDSIGAVKLSGLAQKNGLSLPAQTIYEAPRMEQMVKAARKKSEAAPDRPQQTGTSQALDLKSAWDIINTCLAQSSVRNEDVDDILPCTPFQSHLMQASHDLGAWIFNAVFEVDSNSIDRGKQTLEILRRRTPAFRTRVFQHGTDLYQLVTKEAIEWGEFEGELSVYKAKQTSRRMCYGDPLYRYAVVRDHGKLYLVWTMAHVIYDRFSKMVTLEDLKDCFMDPKEFESRPLRPPFRSFVDFVSTSDEEAGIKFWKNRLQGLKTHELLFPEDRSRPFLNTDGIGYRQMMDYVAPKGTSLTFDTITQTAWTLLMANLAETDDIFYCAFRSCRHMALEGVEDIIGPLWSLVPARRKLDGKQSLVELLTQVHKGTVAGIKHEPFGIQAMDQHFGHKRYLQTVVLPQPPQPDFGATTIAREQDEEFRIRSAEECWTQTRGAYGLYVVFTPKAGGKLEIWVRFDESFISRKRVESIVDQYKSILVTVLEGDWDAMKIQDLCQHLSKPDSETHEALDRSMNGEVQTPKTLTHLFRSQSKTDPALIIPGETELIFSHEKLHSTITTLQHQLAGMGIDKGAAVSIALPNSPELIAVFLAATWQRGIAAPLNPAYKQAEFEFYIDDLGSAVVVVPRGAYEEDSPAVKAARKYEAAIAECWWDFDKGEMVLDVKEEGKLKDKKKTDLLEAEQDDIALVLHTSGTTGRPKAVPLTHGNLMANISNICQTYSLSPKDRTMLIMPLFHVHGLLASFLSPLFSAGSAIVPPRLEPSFWSTFNKYEGNWYSATPSMHRLILQFPPPDPMPKLRFIRSCSSQLSPSLFHQLEDTFHVPVVESYAMTEASHLMASNPLTQGQQRPGSVGKPRIDMRILDADGNEQSNGAEGEVCVRGPNVTHGYLNNPEANKSSFTEERFFRTGDQGKFDGDGYLILTGRLKEMVNKGGEKISPVELDNVISQHDAVGEVVTFAMDDEDYGQDVGCAVKKAEGKDIEERELKEWIGERISAFKIPKKIWFCDDIPKTATGKVQRRLVADAMLKQ